MQSTTIYQHNILSFTILSCASYKYKFVDCNLYQKFTTKFQAQPKSTNPGAGHSQPKITAPPKSANPGPGLGQYKFISQLTVVCRHE